MSELVCASIVFALEASDVCTALHVAAQALVSVVSIVVLSASDFTKVNAVDLS